MLERGPFLAHWIVYLLAAAMWTSTSYAAESKTYIYDESGRVVGVSITGGPNDGGDVTIGYDSVGNRTVYIAGSVSGPQAVNDTWTGHAGDACFGVYVDLVANDLDPNGHYPLQVVSLTGDSGISLSGSRAYYDGYPISRPGTYSAAYVVQNSQGQRSSASVEFIVTGSFRICD